MAKSKSSRSSLTTRGRPRKRLMQNTKAKYNTGRPRKLVSTATSVSQKTISRRAEECAVFVDYNVEILTKSTKDF